MRGIDITGQRFGRLVAMRKTDERRDGCVVWECRCDCGKTSFVRSTCLLRGTSTSCGCKARESASAIAKTGKNRRTHGQNRTKTHVLWQHMKQRCFNPNISSFKDYGGRGISVCNEWRNSFQAFFDYVSKLPHFDEPGYSLDRINNDGNYEPGNVRWATRTEQNNNRRCCKNGVENPTV